MNAQVGIWLSRRLSLKGRAEACAVYVFQLGSLPSAGTSMIPLQIALERCKADGPQAGLYPDVTGV